MRRVYAPWRRKKPSRQRMMGFIERKERMERFFKWTMAFLALLGVVGLLGGIPVGRYLVRRSATATTQAGRRALGFPPSRDAIDADWRWQRERGIAFAGAIYRKVYDEADPRMRRLLRYAGLDPEHAVVRPGNYDQIFILPSTVFLPDDTGRSYRMRPNDRTVWLKGISLPRNLSGFFLVPDRPDLPDMIAGTDAFIVPGSEQTTNSWGLRGPEPDLSAPLRGLILGDSNMQGLFVGDEETPPACLQRELEQSLKTRVALLNTGHLGYSPEQFYYTLCEYADRFRPHFVLLTFCPNDFGDGMKVLQGAGDYEEWRYWYEAILKFCRARRIFCVTSPIPTDFQIVNVRDEGYYPGLACNAMGVGGLVYCNPIEEFVDEHLRLRNDAKREHQPFSGSPLYNGHLHDHHLSARGTALWGRALGRRLTALLEGRRLHHLLDF